MRTRAQLQPNQTADETKTALEELVTFLKTRIPFAVIYTLDLLPQVSTKSWFNCRARIVNKHIGQVCSNHHHVSFFASFIEVTRSQSAARLSPSTEFYGGGDGIHMNQANYESAFRNHAA